MKNKIPKERCCFWIPRPVHKYLKEMANGGKEIFKDKTYSIGDVIIDLCCNASPSFAKEYEEFKKVLNAL